MENNRLCDLIVCSKYPEQEERIVGKIKEITINEGMVGDETTIAFRYLELKTRKEINQLFDLKKFFPDNPRTIPFEEIKRLLEKDLIVSSALDTYSDVHISDSEHTLKKLSLGINGFHIFATYGCDEVTITLNDASLASFYWKVLKDLAKTKGDSFVFRLMVDMKDLEKRNESKKEE